MCAICKIFCGNNLKLDAHMKSVHKETQHQKLLRQTRSHAKSSTVKLVDRDKTTIVDMGQKCFDCTECGTIILTAKDLERHIEEHHKDDNLKTGDVKIEESTSEEEFDNFIKTTKGENPNDHNESPVNITFRGKTPDFMKVRSILEKSLQKAEVFVIGDCQFRVALVNPVRTFSKEVEIEAIISHENIVTKGKARLTVYKEKKKGKKVTIMVSKVTNHDTKFVKSVAENFVQYLLVNFINGDLTEEQFEHYKQSKVGSEKKEPEIECAFCDRKFKSKQGCSLHITHAHPGTKKIKSKNVETLLERKKRLLDEHRVKEYSKKFPCDFCVLMFRNKDVLKSHIEKHLEKKSKFEENLKPTIVRTKDTAENLNDTIKESHKISSACELCGEEFYCKTKSETLANLLKHKQVKHISPDEPDLDKRKCPKCDFKPKSEHELKNHMRDDHLSPSMSTSPPPKKQKAVKGEISDVLNSLIHNVIHISDSEEMEETDHNEQKHEDETRHKVFTQEEMEQDDKTEINQQKCVDKSNDKLAADVNTKMKEHIQDLQTQQDEKILRKRKLLEEQENEKKLKQQKDQLELNKREKQKKNKNSNIEPNNGPTKEKSKEEIPEQYRQLFSTKGLNIDEFELYRVSGNGACGANCIAALLHLDDGMGGFVRRNINQHKCRFWDEKYKDYYEYPFHETVGGEEMSWETSEDLKIFIKTNPKASFMWLSHVDFQATAIMYKTNVHILTTGVAQKDEPCTSCKEKFKTYSEKREHIKVKHGFTIKEESDDQIEGKKVKARWTHYEPDENINDTYEIDQNYEMETPDIFLMHEDEVHFNLLIPKRSTLAMQGRVITKDENREFAKDQSTKEVNKGTKAQETDGEKIIKLKKILKSKDSDIKLLKNDNIKAQKEMYKMETEMQKMRIQLKTLSQYKELIEAKESLTKENESSEETQFSDKNYDEVDLDELDSENVLYSNKVKGFQRDGPQNKVLENKFHCIDCSFVANSKEKVEKHIKLHDNDVFCQQCGKNFQSNKELNRHYKTEHIEWNCDDCDFQAFSNRELKQHKQQRHSETESIQCRNCGEMFSSKWNLMNHRRNMHPTNKPCRNDAIGRCNFTAEVCWWKHKSKVHTNNLHNAQNNGDNFNNNFTCFECNHKFELKDNLMKHKKREHPENCKECSKFNIGKCNLKDQDCWFIHSEMGFQKSRNKAAPPETNQQTM